MTSRMIEMIMKQGGVRVPSTRGDMDPDQRFVFDKVNNLATLTSKEVAARDTDPHPFPCINIKNVADYAIGQSREHDIKKMADLPSIMPPWNHFWMEAPIRIKIVDEETWKIKGGFTTEFGIMVNANRPEGDGAAIVREEAERVPGTVCAADFQLYMVVEGAVVGPVGVWQANLDEQGMVLDEKFATTIRQDSVTEAMQWEESMNEIVMIAGWALAFINCKNTELVEQKISEKVERKRRAKLGGLKPVRYSMIKVDSFGRSGGGRGGPDDRGEHIVRGHFSHYGNCCPGRHEPQGKLFGRWEGRYWMPQHRRGSRAHGVVQQDYEVMTTEYPDGS